MNIIKKEKYKILYFNKYNQIGGETENKKYISTTSINDINGYKRLILFTLSRRVQGLISEYDNLYFIPGIESLGRNEGTPSIPVDQYFIIKFKYLYKLIFNYAKYIDISSDMDKPENNYDLKSLHNMEVKDSYDFYNSIYIDEKKIFTKFNEIYNEVFTVNNSYKIWDPFFNSENFKHENKKSIVTLYKKIFVNYIQNTFNTHSLLKLPSIVELNKKNIKISNIKSTQEEMSTNLDSLCKEIKFYNLTKEENYQFLENSGPLNNSDCIIDLLIKVEDYQNLTKEENYLEADCDVYIRLFNLNTQ